jgi:energy-converting hydrogenase A subunit R
MSVIDIPPAAGTIEHFSHSDQTIIGRLDEIFWSQIPQMFVGKFLVDVVTVGGEQKAEAIREVVKRLDVELANVMYVGDSLTDVEAFKLVRAGGGLTVSFNGNGYAVKTAEVAVLSESNLVTAVIADLFCKFGKDVTVNALQDWGFPALEFSEVDAALLKQLSSLYPDDLPKAQIVTAQNMESLTKESGEFRKKVRGVAIGRLG